MALASAPRRLVLLLCLTRGFMGAEFVSLCTCEANPESSITGAHGPTGITGHDIIDDVEKASKTADAIESVVSKITSWMSEKQKHAKRTKEDFEQEDILDLQHQRRPSESRDFVLPFVTLAYAQTLDGMMAARTPERGTTTSNLRLSSLESMILTHRLRSMHDAILVGGSTFLLDCPRLNVRLPTEYACSHEIEHPIPVVLDTHLKHLQLLLFGEVVSDTSSLQTSTQEAIVPDISMEGIRARHPVVCCSPAAAKSFLDVLEEFQEQHAAKRKSKRTYKITVYKKIDEDFDHERDNFLPIKISIQITHHDKKEDVIEDLMVTLLPCPIVNRKAKRRPRLNLRQVLRQLYDHFDVGSVMVEGGAGILSSFLNEHVHNGNDDGKSDSLAEQGKGEKEDGTSYTVGERDKMVDCVCVTIAPKVIGGKWGLPVLRGFDMLNQKLETGDGYQSKRESDGGDDENNDPLPGMITVRESDFVPIGTDCTFLGRM